MQQREKNLAIAVGGVAALVAAWFLYDAVSGTFATSNGRAATLQKQIKTNDATIREYHQQQQKLAELKRLSLPVDYELARNEYSTWLLRQGTQAGLTGLDVTPTANQSVQGNFEKNTFTLDGAGSLENIVKFMYGFYQGDHLHKIHTLTIKPNDKSKNFTLQVSIEALSIAGEEKKLALNATTSSRLAEKDFAKYKDSIVGRNLFAAYVPPPPKPPERVKVVDTPTRRAPDLPPPPFDDARFAYVTSFLNSKAGPEAWMYIWTKGPNKVTLHEGDSIDVGTVRGQVTRIGQNFLEFSSDGHRKRVAPGISLRDATEEASTETSTETPKRELTKRLAASEQR